MPEVMKDVVNFVDGKGNVRPALVKGVHQSNKDVMHPWLTLCVIKDDPNAMDEVNGTQSRQHESIAMVPHKINAGPAPHWVERE